MTKMNAAVHTEMDHLPDEIILLIFDYSSGYDLTTSFQRVCTRWNYLINRSDKIWRGNVHLKGLTEQRCKSKLCDVLKRTPKLKYLQIGKSRAYRVSRVNETGNGNGTDWPTQDILKTVRVYNKELEYLHVIDRFPLVGSIDSLLNRTNFKRLKITLDKLCDRRQKIDDLKKIFRHFPEVDNLYIDFSQRIQFYCEKRNFEWKISQDFRADDTENEFV